MGKLALELIEASQHTQLHAALDSKSELTELVGADVVFEVTKLEVSEQVVEYCIANGLKVVVGTSGWSAGKLAEIEAKLAAAPEAAVLVVPNFSIGSMLQN
jgi:4-hydroxy-tetrahydrodipicolinate reductase